MPLHHQAVSVAARSLPAALPAIASSRTIVAPATAFLLTLVVVACGKSQHARRDAGAEPAAAEPAAAEPAGVASSHSDAEQPGREIFQSGFYRAPNGTATVTLPELGRSRWQVSLGDSGPMRKLTLVMGPPQTPLATVELLFLPAATEEIDPEPIARQIAAGFAKRSSGLKPLGKGRPLPHTGGRAFAMALGEIDRSGESTLVGVVAITDGKCGVISVHRGPEKLVTGGEVRRVLDAIHGSLRVGTKVRRLPQHDPGVPLTGIYLDDTRRGGDDSVYDFDPRGFYHGSLPTSALDLDFTARYQWDDRRMGTYQVSGNDITLTPFGGETRRARFAVDASGITIDDDRYLRIDGGHADGWKLDGVWTCLTFQQNLGPVDDLAAILHKTLYFTKDGRFSFQSFADAGTTRSAGAPPPHGPGGLLGVPTGVRASSETPATSGGYLIRDDRLVLWFDDGRSVELSLYPQPSRPTGDFHDQRLYIGGFPYSKGE